MYDTITTKPQKYSYDSISALIDSLDDASVKFNKDGTMLKTGSYNHVRLFLTQGMLAVNFNPNKIINGTNEIDAPISSLNDVLTSLEDWLGIDLHNAPVSRLDFGKTIAVCEKPHKYIELLAHCSRAKKSCYENETLVFANGIKKIMFYDKGLEIEAKKIELFTSTARSQFIKV